MTAAPMLDAVGGPGDVRVLEARYRLTDELDRDIVSVSWRAVDERLARTVVVRLFDVGTTEAVGVDRVLATVAHPGLVTVYDAGVTPDGEVYVVTAAPAARPAAAAVDALLSTETGGAA